MVSPSLARAELLGGTTHKVLRVRILNGGVICGPSVMLLPSIFLNNPGAQCQKYDIILRMCVCYVQSASTLYRERVCDAGMPTLTSDPAFRLASFIKT